MTEKSLNLSLKPHEVTLHYPGAEGVVFEDAVLEIRNPGAAATGSLALRLRVEQDGKGLLLDGDVGLGEMEKDQVLPPGGECRVSLFRILQKKNQGFSSRVNMFGFKAAMEWRFRVSAQVVGGEPAAPLSPEVSRAFLWTKEEATPERVSLKVE